jgi:two-component system, LuxR family, response regulator TtrR
MESLQRKTLWVALVDDDEPVRDSMRWLLEANGFQARAFATADEFLAALPLEDLGCIVLDVRMPGMGGIELHDELLRRELDTPVLFVTGHGDVPMAVARMKGGAVDFLEKPFNDAQMCKLVRQCLDRAEAKQVAQDLRTTVNTRLERLTGRERQVLDLIVAGRLNKQIADDLTISIKTVEAHRANIMDKLNARSMADLMKIALHAAEIPREGA